MNITYFKKGQQFIAGALTALLILALAGCGGGESFEEPSDSPNSADPVLSDEELLQLTQKETFKYFWDYAEPISGAARERFHPEDPSFDQQVVTTGGTGFGLMAIITGVERNFISRSESVKRLQQILAFYENADRFHGAWPHWMDGGTGKVIPFSERDDGGDLVETAFLCQGLICVKEYFKNGSSEEKDLALLADRLWKGVEWDWYTRGQDALYWHWSPNHEFSMNLSLSGYNEVLITYVMAAASPDHSIDRETYRSGWASYGAIKNDGSAYGIPLRASHQGAPAYGGPLFWAHYSYLGLDPRNLRDEFLNYWEVNVNHAMINYLYCVENPKNFAGYGEDCWGLTASYSLNTDGSLGYAAHAPGNDLGVISPTAAVSSMPYTPEASLKALRHFYNERNRLLGPAGFYDAFKPGSNWTANAYLAIDQGPVVIMIENYRTGLLWELFMKNQDIQNGLGKLGFSY